MVDVKQIDLEEYEEQDYEVEINVENTKQIDLEEYLNKDLVVETSLANSEMVKHFASNINFFT